MHRAQELCESRGGRPGLPVPNKPTVSVDVKQHFNNNRVVPSPEQIPVSMHYLYIYWQITPLVSLYEVTRTSKTQEMMGLWIGGVGGGGRAGGGEYWGTT